MNKNDNGFSLVIVVIFMSIAALFIGYLMGNWLISFLVEDDSAEIAEQQQNTPNINQQKTETGEEAAEEVNNKENNLTAPTEEELKIAPEQNDQSPAAGTAATNQEQNAEPTESEQSSENNEIAGDFGVQIGAFSNYNNALSLKDSVEDLGFEAVITD